MANHDREDFQSFITIPKLDFLSAFELLVYLSTSSFAPNPFLEPINSRTRSSRHLSKLCSPQRRLFAQSIPFLVSNLPKVRC